MKSLEQIAKKMFSDYAMKHAGHYLDWRFLSAERRIIWIKEVADKYLQCLAQCKEELSIGKLPMPGVASYERGFVAGQAFEAHRLQERIDTLIQMVESELYSYVAAESDNAN